MLAARLLRQMTDSIMLVDSAAAIVLMGDFNDETEQESISEGLGAMDDIIQDRDGYLVDVTYLYSRNSGFGSHKSMGSWGLLDHFIISAALLNRDAALYQAPGASGIFTAGFLLEEDRRNLGMKTYRTYQGPHYHGGFSDHLPIWLDLQCRPEKR
jgi:endonuclease/exonuclease/phosphatase family metal-dependent hydrolase